MDMDNVFECPLQTHGKVSTNSIKMVLIEPQMAALQNAKQLLTHNKCNKKKMLCCAKSAGKSKTHRENVSQFTQTLMRLLAEVQSENNFDKISIFPQRFSLHDI